jgi:hypothetical protein
MISCSKISILFSEMNPVMTELVGKVGVLQHSISGILQEEEEEGRRRQARCSVCSQPMEKERLHYGGMDRLM